MESFVPTNPVKRIRQKSQFVRTQAHHVRDIVQRCFDNAVFRLNKDGMVNDAGHSSSAKKKKLRPLE